ncbi:unnamed protein product [Urochloa decumbens]|uniref:Uncharacterized protein n=1 Tax=Urochloa decumbens TaxID=240449 RepID=A0ABC9BV68_9POAL
MEAISLTASVIKSLEAVRNMVKENNDLQEKLRNGLEFIKSELTFLSSDAKKVLEDNSLCTKPQEWILQLQDLAYDIEDFIYERRRDPKTSAPVQVLQVALLTHPGPKHLSRLDLFKDRIKEILSRKGRAPAATTATHQLPQQSPCKSGLLVTPRASTSAAHAEPPVGMVRPVNELVELLLEADGDGHQNHVKVISILGRGGLGKTTLARELYSDHRVIERFPRYRRAMVEAPPSSDHVGSTLQAILQQLGYYRTWRGAIQLVVQRLPHQAAAGNDSGNDEQLKNCLQAFLRDKRYLVIFDGVENRKVWDTIRSAFPDNEQGSRLVVTTSIRSIATGCSKGSYLYSMSGLDSDASANLFWAKLGPDNRQPALEEGLRTFFRKCDGLPLALVGTAEYLRGKGEDLNDEHCEDVGDSLGKLLTGEEAAFADTRTALARCCDRVCEPDQKMCMLSVGSFPMGHRINRKTLIRRWIAEDLVAGDFQLGKDRVATGYLDNLLDLGIVESVPCGNNVGDASNKVKWCQVHGVMLEFLVRQSASWNFTTLIEDNKVVRNHQTSWPARRLAVHGAASDKDVQTAGTIRLSHIRSLTARNTNNLMSCLKSCSRLRVLDLESCSWLGNGHLGVICGLLHLRYLSLRRTGVSELPNDIKDLHCLETLDVRQTGVDRLPLEVITLPLLAHLFGKFELPDQLQDESRAGQLKEFFSQKSRLQTLSGFKVVNNQGFELILQHASKLKKVKIWCELPPPPPPPRPPRRGLSAFTKSIITNSFRKTKINVVVPSVADLTGSLASLLEKRFAGSDALDSLSVDFGGHCQDFLGSVLKDPCAVSSIKVCGQMETLPASSTLEKLRNIKKMHLCNTGLLSEALSGLHTLNCLVYLKLVENRISFWEGSFVVKTNGFRSLKQLCFDGPKIPDLEFEQEAKCPLVSLQLICLEPAKKLGVTGIAHLQRLSQVILHPDAPPEKMEAWKQEAIKHKNRPYVQKQPGSSEEA